jgi:NAD(P)-dependent dehydrogenase (short-subunit alcohol dehydrogenase family)
LLANGWHVLAGVRDPGGFESPDPARCHALALDLIDDDSISAASESAISLAQALPSRGLDAVIHNAGVTAYGAFEETPPEVWRSIFQTNLFGPMELTRRLLPHLREQRSHIIIVSSEAAAYGFPAVGVYAASKAAASRWGESLAHEVRPLGVRVTIVEPGAHATSITTDYPQYRDDTGPYAGMYRTLDALTDLGRRIARPPDSFAEQVVKILSARRPPIRRSIGTEAWAINIASRLLPSRAMASSVGRMSRHRG